MDYEKKYKEALKRATELSDAGNALTKLQLGIIFPELAESEDERIRHCIEMALTDVPEKRFKDFRTTLKDCLAWLEKQKEQKPTYHKFRVGDRIKSDIREYSVYEICDGYYKLFNDEVGALPAFLLFCDEDKYELVKQKPESEEEKDVSYQYGLGIWHEHQGWSEEDMNMIDDLLEVTKGAGWHKYSIWLNSLKDRIKGR